MTESTRSYYDRFYGSGGWRYDPAKARAFLSQRVAKPAGWNAGTAVLELGCGMGHHAALLHGLGPSVTAVDFSKSGIASAKKTFRGPTYVHADVTKWRPDAPFDGIFVRGLSVYHYELDGKNKHGQDVPALTARFFGWLKSGGTFVLQIVTDFSGRRPKDTVHSSKLSAYRELFDPRGTVYRVTDFEGRPLTSDEQAQREGKGGIVIFTRKP